MEEPRVCAEHERRRQAHEQAMAVRRSSLHRCEPDQVPRVCLSRCDPSPAAPPLQCVIEACLVVDGERAVAGTRFRSILEYPSAPSV